MGHGLQNGHDGGVRSLQDVWDWQTRVLHWLNALLIVTLILLIIGKEGMELLGVEKALRAPLKRFHAYAGHIFAITFILRVAWGFLGNAYARWSDIIPVSRERWVGVKAGAKWYLSGLRGHPASARGHDPLAGVFYTVIFATLAWQVASGIALSGIELNTFPGSAVVYVLGGGVAKAIKHPLEEAHEFGMFVVMIFTALHIAGLVAHEVKSKSGLFSSMIHGKKYFPPGR